MASRDAPECCRLDGRRLAYATYGDPDGRPVLFCHGTPGSRLLGRLLDAAAAQRGVRLIAPDRPGIGQSDPHPTGIDDWPADVDALCSHLGVESAGVVGFSGGAPFALACSRLDRVEWASLVSGAGPPGIGDAGLSQRVFGTLARTAPRLLSPLFRVQRWLLARRDPEAALALVADGRPETDDRSAGEVARLVKADVLESTANGPRGVIRELGLLAEPWPFDLDAVDVPVTVFQGQRDTNVAPATGEALARRLPDATLERVDADHLGTLCVAGRRAVRGPTPV
jgi:pimeloyl-ACP methyl ester carboxylesterase